MFTSSITSQDNGVATVVFTKDTGETETYTEQITVSDAVFATETTPFIPPVYEIVTHTRPKVVTVTETITYTDNADLSEKVQARTDALNAGTIVKSAEELERETWLQQFQLLQRSLKAKQTLEAVGLSFSTDEQTAFDHLVQWVAANRKTEYVNYM